MKLAYIILAHKLPQQLYRLVSRLQSPENIFVIHLCRNTSKDDAQEAVRLLKNMPNVYFCKREDGSWGEFGIVQAVLNGMELLHKKRSEFDYLNVISGNDYPIKSNLYLKKFFTENYGKQFLWYLSVYNYIPVGVSGGNIYDQGWYGYRHPWGATHRFLRFEKYWFSIFGERLMTVPDERFLNKPLRAVLKEFFEGISKSGQINLKREVLLMVLSFIYRKKRKLPEGYAPHAGSQWFSITNDCMEYILKINRENPEVKNFFKHTLLPDESFFTTILVHSPYKEKITQNNYRFIRWPHEPPQTHPLILRAADIDEIKRSDKLFARKFDITVDKEILDLIDNEILIPHNCEYAG